jgi:hypothetical protein
MIPEMVNRVNPLSILNPVAMPAWNGDAGPTNRWYSETKVNRGWTMSAGQVVAKKSGGKAGKGESRRFGVLVRLAAGMVADAKLVAAHRGISMAEYLSERFWPIVKQDLDEEMRKKLKGKSS